MKIHFEFWFALLLFVLSGSTGNSENEEAANLNQTFFISEIFDKYGNNNVMTYESQNKAHLFENFFEVHPAEGEQLRIVDEKKGNELIVYSLKINRAPWLPAELMKKGFEHLLENLGLGKLKFERKHDVSVHKINGTFREVHDELSLHKHNHGNGNSFSKDSSEGGNIREKRNIRSEENVEKTLRRKCLSAQDILTAYGLEPYHEVLISPTKYLQMCPAIVYELDQKLCQENEAKEIRQEQKEHHLVWIYASISILVMGMSGMLCVLMVPLIKKDCYSPLMQFLVSLAVGTLCGDALIHLIPQVFFINEESGSKMIVISRGTLALLAIYFFFTIENILKGKREEKEKGVDNQELGAMMQPFESQGHLPSQKTRDIKTIAWMAIMGDILHNVTDGLSIGAAFSRSISSGFASSIAIFCHELPHELGDYAILLASGMSVKKSLFYNIISSIFSFLGMIGGVLLGEMEDASLWINAFTAGSFLYIALSDLVPEMKNKQLHFKNFIVQITGLACGGILMFTIGIFEDEIECLL